MRRPYRRGRPSSSTDAARCWLIEPSLDSISFKITLQWFGNNYAAVRLLIRLNQCDKQPSQSRAAAIENVRELVFSCGGLIAQIHATSLEIFAIGDAGYFEITPLP